MPTELEELVEFLHHGNSQIRQVACENLVGFSVSQPLVFKGNQLSPLRDLKLLVCDYSPIAKDALTILVNLSADQEVLTSLAEDDIFLETLLVKVMDAKEPNAAEISMLLANLGKSESMNRIISLRRNAPRPPISESPRALDQLMDCFVKSGEGSKGADYDFLAYLFADLTKSPEGRAYFTTRQEYDSVVPITKLTVFTEHESDVRRRGVASVLKNTAFNVSAHPKLLAEGDVNLLPYILLPIMGSELFSEDETAAMLPDLQFLPPDKKRDQDNSIILTHLETLLLLTTTREGRDRMRDVQVYPIIRECHLHVDDEGVREGCDRLVQLLMRGEPSEQDTKASSTTTIRAGNQVETSEGVDSDEEIVEVLL